MRDDLINTLSLFSGSQLCCSRGESDHNGYFWQNVNDSAAGSIGLTASARASDRPRSKEERKATLPFDAAASPSSVMNSCSITRLFKHSTPTRFEALKFRRRYTHHAAKGAGKVVLAVKSCG